VFGLAEPLSTARVDTDIAPFNCASTQSLQSTISTAHIDAMSLPSKIVIAYRCDYHLNHCSSINGLDQLWSIFLIDHLELSGSTIIIMIDLSIMCICVNKIAVEHLNHLYSWALLQSD
jgi:hypothetical protein